ncbi:MAG: bifunctional nicotinamidase/pyrazinamidase [Chlamydiae bacterium]|nr:bifunctional nicotinamidase/pyrazinamidase [Chlamydiota bacterium]
MRCLLIVDMQNDFMSSGTLPVPEGDQIISLINQLMPKFSLIVATQDWHPLNHVSFAKNHPKKKAGDIIQIKGKKQTLWPVHCVQGTKGAELVLELNKQPIAALFKKGVDTDVDSYSAFFDNAKVRSTGLHQYLMSRKIKEIYVAGVATEYCVFFSILDGLDLGYKVHLIIDGCRGIYPKDVKQAVETMNKKGAKILFSQAINFNGDLF